jgi:hypothetical protein
MTRTSENDIKLTGFFISNQIHNNIKYEKVIPNIMSVDTMDLILHYTKKEEVELDNYFTKDGLYCVNKNCKEGNYYAFDKYGLIIRRKAFNDNKNMYGWIYNDNREPISIHIDNQLILVNSPKIFPQTIQKLKSKYGQKCFGPRSIYERVAIANGIQY